MNFAAPPVATAAVAATATTAAAETATFERSLLDQVTVVVVTYNSAHCVPALATGLQDVPHLVVVDNASNDGCLAAVAAALPQANRLALPHNRGYGVANNEGLARVATPYALLLNPDCEISASQIAALVQAAHTWPDAAAIAPQLVDGAGRKQVNYSWPRDAWQPRTAGASGPLTVGYACAAVLLLNLARLASIGHFDPRFFLYYEDEDLCLRIHHARRAIVVVPQIEVVHLSRGSVRGQRPWRAEYWRGYHHVQSKVRFIAKHAGPAAGVQALRRLRMVSALHLLARALVPSPKHLARTWGRCQGVWQMRLEPDCLSC